ncbi:MAG: BlaI/MecI/CopY family transcriptional regulator [Agathobacter sp.]|nr:BlaI/MecI/CopY family transcriptional regulator [Agathobacter sp.]
MGEKNEIRLAMVESSFADIIWEHEPVPSGELVKLCEEKLNWKKSTTYTVLRKLCERGIFQNVDGIVTSILSKEEVQVAQSEQFLSETFGGSLPAFIAAFASKNKLSKEDISEISKMIDSIGEE